jgi:hypothetical protein
MVPPLRVLTPVASACSKSLSLNKDLLVLAHVGDVMRRMHSESDGVMVGSRSSVLPVEARSSLAVPQPPCPLCRLPMGRGGDLARACCSHARSGRPRPRLNLPHPPRRSLMGRGGQWRNDDSDHSRFLSSTCCKHLRWQLPTLASGVTKGG